MFHELVAHFIFQLTQVATSKNYVRGVSAIEAEWFQSVAPGVMGLSAEIRSSDI